MCPCVRVHAWVCVCVCACVHVCVRVHMLVYYAGACASIRVCMLHSMFHPLLGVLECACIDMLAVFSVWIGWLPLTQYSPEVKFRVTNTRSKLEEIVSVCVDFP